MLSRSREKFLGVTPFFNIVMAKAFLLFFLSLCSVFGPFTVSFLSTFLKAGATKIHSPLPHIFLALLYFQLGPRFYFLQQNLKKKTLLFSCCRVPCLPAVEEKSWTAKSNLSPPPLYLSDSLPPSLSPWLPGQMLKARTEKQRGWRESMSPEMATDFSSSSAVKNLIQLFPLVFAFPPPPPFLVGSGGNFIVE